MFTKNWYSAVYSAFTQTKLKHTTMDGTERDTVVDRYGVIMPALSGDTYYYAPLGKVLKALNTYGGVIFGTGNTPAQITDVALSGELVTTFASSYSIATRVDNDEIVLEALYTLTNTGSNPITIGEIGMIANLNNASASALYKALLERTALESPITIPAGGVGQVIYTIRMNYPAA